MVYSHETDLLLNDLTDRDPVYCVTVPTGYNTSKLKQDGLIVHTFRTYDVERTICDMLRDKKNRILQQYQMRSKDMSVVLTKI